MLFGCSSTIVLFDLLVYYPTEAVVVGKQRSLGGGTNL